MDPLERARHLRDEAVAARHAGDLDRALGLDLEAVDLFRRAGDPEWIARGCAAVASDHALMGSPHAAEEWDLRAVEAADRSGDPTLRVMSRTNLALDLCELSRPDDALPHLRQALRLAVEHGRQPLIYRERHSLGYGLAQLGRWEAAVVEFEMSAEDQRRVGETPDELAATLMELAGCYAEQGRIDDAVRVLEEACADFERVGDGRSAEGCRARIAELRDL